MAQTKALYINDSVDKAFSAISSGGFFEYNSDCYIKMEKMIAKGSTYNAINLSTFAKAKFSDTETVAEYTDISITCQK